MKNLCLIILIFLFSEYSNASSSTISNGAWSNHLKWTNGIPLTNDTATILNVMSLDNHLSIFNGKYTIDGGSLIDNLLGINHNLTISGEGALDVGGQVEIGGNVLVEDYSELIIRGCQTFVIRGNLIINDSAKLFIENCANLLVQGNMFIDGKAKSFVDGSINVIGHLTSNDSATIAGTGTLVTGSTVSIYDNSSVFGISSDCFLGPCLYMGGSLPIDLKNLSAKYVSHDLITISWETVTELNNDFFTIEYSTDGKRFTKGDNVPGAGTSNHTISYTMTLNTSYDKLFIRLRQTDFDGSSTVSETISVKRKIDLIPSIKLLLFPNPGNGNTIRVQVKGLNDETYKIKILNYAADIVYERFVQNHSETTDLFVSSLSLPKGLYYIYLHSKSGVISEKYIVQ